ncbi:hypothetical protein GCM10028773_35900 [Spirosoma koreense]
MKRLLRAKKEQKKNFWPEVASIRLLQEFPIFRKLHEIAEENVVPIDADKGGDRRKKAPNRLIKAVGTEGHFSEWKLYSKEL